MPKTQQKIKIELVVMEYKITKILFLGNPCGTTLEVIFIMRRSDNSIAKALSWLKISTNLIYSERVYVHAQSCATLCNPARLLCPWNSLGKNTGVGCHFLLQGIFPTQGLNLCLLHLLNCHLWRPYKAEDETEITVSLNLHKGHEGNLGGDEAVTYLNCDASYMTAFCQNSELLDFTPKFSQLSIKVFIFSQIL